MNKSRFHQPYFLYLLAVTCAGLALVVVGLLQFPTFDPKATFLLILTLAVFAEITSTTVKTTAQGIGFEVGTAVSLVLIPLYGPEAAVLAATACTVTIWLLKLEQGKAWKKSWEPLAFNVGMHSVAIYIAGVVFLNLQRQLDINTLLGQMLPWIITAVLYDQLNFGMVMVIIRLKQGPAVSPLAMWKENMWAAPINIMILAVGGGTLALAVNQFGVVGIIIFFMPIVLSAYAFRLYVNQMQAHMDNLEHIVSQRTEELQKVMQEKDAFLAVLTHDMKSPLTSIHMYATMLKEYPQIIQQKPHMLDAVLHSQETLTGIVNNILDLEKLKADGQVPMEKTDFDFVVVAEKVLSMVQVQADSKHIALLVDGLDRHTFVYADQNHLERILNNLITNAIKYTPENGRVTVTLATQDNQLILQVQDSGFGIPAEDLPYVFERFHRVVSHRKLAAGTGLGLAITKALVEAHDGKIEVISKEGYGSCFTAYLPVLPPPPHNQPNANKPSGQTQQQHAVNMA
ncbi:MAG: HAMP domain-containing histidine kinase [Ardenticatenaceae bacterium]|nr:HAMP domain-containing histidine kinase [Ardenticatenaceae bacterium]